MIKSNRQLTSPAKREQEIEIGERENEIMIIR